VLVGKAVTCFLFNVVLGNVRNSRLKIRRNIFLYSVQVITYADHVDIIEPSLAAVKKAFIKLEKAAREMHLTFTEGEIKYMRRAYWDRVYSTAYIKI
jgi:hypothetical protein